MKKTFKPQRSRWAASLCYASALLLAVGSLRAKPMNCFGFEFDAEQAFVFDAGLATFFMFLGTFVLTGLLVEQRGGK